MKQQKPHARIHQVILQLRQKSRQQLNDVFITNDQFSYHKPACSTALTMENSDILSLNETQSIILPQNYYYHPNSLNLMLNSNPVSSETLSPQKSPDSDSKREIKTARPVSRKKITSKEKSIIPNSFKSQQTLAVTNQKRSSHFQLLNILSPSYFIIDKNQSQKEELQNKQIKTLKAFWSLHHQFVSLFPIEYTECIIYNHPNIIPVYGQVKISDKRFVVSNQYKNSSLRDLISEFGQFEQRLCKKYLYQIICGVQEMHNRKTTHNRLCTKNILYNKQGQVFVNVVKSTSRPLSEKEKQQNLFQYSPQILLTKTKSNSLKNDIWSIGVILLDMLFNFSFNDIKTLFFHPYNGKEKLSQHDSIIVDNLKQLYPKSFIDNINNQALKKCIQKYEKLSAQCKDLISKCLLLNKDERIDIKRLKTHKFFG